MAKDKLAEGFKHCEMFFKDNYKNATLDQKNWFLAGVIALRDYLEQK